MTEPSGRSKGCAVVEYSNAEHAQRAIAELNDTELMGRLIFVREDREDSGEVICHAILRSPRIGMYELTHGILHHSPAL